MATTSEVKAGLDTVAQTITQERQRLTNAQAAVLRAFNTLFSLPTTHAAVITEINGYTGSDPFVLLAKDELAKLTTEFIVLRDAADAANVALDAFTEF